MANHLNKPKDVIKNYGFDSVATKASMTPDDFVFGDNKLEDRFSALIPLRPDGQWDKDLPAFEPQSFPWGDTFHCPVYGTENAIQTLAKAKYNYFEEFTERFLGVLAGITQLGGSPHTVAEKWRSNGNLDYKFLPFDNIRSWAEWNSPNPMTATLIAEGKKWLLKFSIGHDWVRDFNPVNLKEALKYSPLGIGVYAWPSPDAQGIYHKPVGVTDNHWIIMYGYEDGKYWKVYDSYDGGYKKLAWDYGFVFAKRFHLESLDPNIKEVKKNDMQISIEVVKRKGTPHFLFQGSDNIWHRIGDERTFAALVGSFNQPIEEVDLAEEAIGEPIYLGKSFLSLITSFFSNLKGR